MSRQCEMPLLCVCVCFVLKALLSLSVSANIYVRSAANTEFEYSEAICGDSSATIADGCDESLRIGISAPAALLIFCELRNPRARVRDFNCTIYTSIK